MSDLISKRFIQDALIEKISNLNAEGATQTARELIRLKKFVDGLTPSADRPTGEWVVKDGETVCSLCGNSVSFSRTEDGWVLGKFCQTCGAEMRGEEE